MSYAALVLADAVQAWYRMGETSGTTMVDSSGNGRNGVYSTPGTTTLGATGALVGDSNTAATFLGATSSATAAVAGASSWMRSSDSQLTVELWLKTTDSSTVIYCNTGVDFRMALTAAGFLEWRVTTGGVPTTVTGSTNLRDGAWHHLVGTYDGTQIRCYADAVLQATAAKTGLFGTSGSGVLQFPYLSGSGAATTSTVDEVAIYGTALSGTRIAEHYAAATVPDPGAPALSLGAALAMPTGSFAVSNARRVSLTAPLSLPVGSFDLIISTGPEPEPEDSAPTALAPGDGRARGGYGVATWEPPVVAAPVHLTPAHAVVAAETYSDVTMTGTRPTITGRTGAERPRHRDRIVVAGRDITYWRGVATPTPTYGLVEPLLYGSGSLTLPQIAACYETPGRGALAWLRPGAPVKVQRVNPATGDVVATDYRGFIEAIDLSGKTARFNLGGEAIGRANLIDKQPPIFRRVRDLGWWWWRTLSDVGRPFEPAGGPTTGINLVDSGGLSLGSYAQQLAANGVNTAGAQWTCMPNAAGVYRVRRKDLTTIDGTVYLDDARTVASLRRDVAEEPNRIFGTGVTPAGMRVKFGVYPVLGDHRAVAYPNDGGRQILPGDTDTDTDSGGGVTALIKRLTQTGYITVLDRIGGYDSDVGAAVRDLQADAGLPETGAVNQATWTALYDVEVTGYDTTGSHIEPIVQRNRVRRVRRTATGNVIGPNPTYNPHALVVDRTMDYGTGQTRARMRAWARDELTPDGDGNWVGTITFNTGALVEGEHTPGDPITTSQVMHARALRPGMNLWLPLFDGGTLVHVSGVDVRPGNDGPDTIVASVDTQARDTMKVWEVIARNRETRRDPARSWLRDHRSSSYVKDAVTEFDEVGGIITDTDLDEGWNVFPVVAGQEGTIARLRMSMTMPTEYVVAVFGRRVGRRRLAQLVPNPLTEPGTKRWSDEGVRSRLDRDVLLYAAGNDTEPCGYFPGTKPDTGPGLATGRWEDDAGFGYRTFEQSCVLWVAVYAANATTLVGGRIMSPQLEAGS